MKAVIALDGRAGEELAARLRDVDVDVRGVVPAGRPAEAAHDALSSPEAAELLAELSRADLLLIACRADIVTSELVGACDRWGVRIIPLCASGSERRFASSLGLVPRAIDDAVEDVLASGVAQLPAPRERGRVLAVWGAHGAPGRTTLAIEVACALAASGRRAALVDADTHAPSVALATGLADEGPGFAAACRQAERGALSVTELNRISVNLGDVDVLTGLNRPGRWPELSASRVIAALDACREWADDVVVDVAASLEADEEIVSDLVDGPRRNAATRATLEAADHILAVVAADPVGVARFVRTWPDLRAAVGATPVRVVVNKTRAGALGIDARGQIRRTLERYAGIREISFVPWDAKGTDAAMLAARPVAHIAPRSAIAAAARRLVDEALTDAPATGVDPGRAVRRRRLARTA